MTRDYIVTYIDFMDDIFKALNDPTRREILDRLKQKSGQTVIDLTQQLTMTRFGVMKHLKVLEDANLITTHREGRFKYHYFNPVPLQALVDRWVEPMLAQPLTRMVLDLKSQMEGPQNMTKPDFVLETLIQTSAEDLWEALTQPHMIEKYQIMASKPVAPIDGLGRVEYIMPQGGVMLACDVTAYDPPHRMEMSFEPNWAGPDMEISRIVYEIEARGKSVKLRVSHYDIPEGQDGVKEGWMRTFSALKTLLETGKPLEFDPQ